MFFGFHFCYTNIPRNVVKLTCFFVYLCFCMFFFYFLRIHTPRPSPSQLPAGLAPIKLLFPRDVFAEELKFAMLGLGDIVIPGVGPATQPAGNPGSQSRGARDLGRSTRGAGPMGVIQSGSMRIYYFGGFVLFHFFAGWNRVSLFAFPVLVLEQYLLKSPFLPNIAPYHPPHLFDLILCQTVGFLYTPTVQKRHYGLPLCVTHKSAPTYNKVH